MNIVQVRSPFIITVAEAGQSGSKIELFIWNQGVAEPTLPTYTFSKTNASASQITNVYNVSNYVREYIDNYINNDSAYADAMNATDWCLFRVKRYKFVVGLYTELSNTQYVGLNGYTEYSNGRQQASNVNMKFLSYSGAKKYYPDNTFSVGGSWQGTETLGTFCFIIEKTAIQTVTLRYYNLDFTEVFAENLQNDNAGIFAYEVPNTYVVNGGSAYRDGTYIVLTLNNIVQFSQYTYPVCEPKYTPIRCNFINRFGGWETLWFFKAQTNNISAKGTDYKLTQDSVNYISLKGQYKTFNINGKQTIKVNTGWVDENYSFFIQDLLLSENVLLNNKPVNLKTSSSDLKTTLKDKNINYELEFEYAYNLINDVV